MFSSTSLEKSPFLVSENSSPSRVNVSTKVPVGFPSLGDENHQIRIQLAVHKYNSSVDCSGNSRRSVMSPVKHSFLKNSLKPKNYVENEETGVKNDKKCGNRYEGVGAFPTVHLKKSAIRYRPIRRFKDVKVPTPELPVNRFLNQLPELCPDLKSGTRSVLDVLQDLSRKKIQSKEIDDSVKVKSKGLCGDYVVGGDAAYKPLFVQKPTLNAILTRDNTTQTLSSSIVEGSPSPKISGFNSSTQSQDSSDPRVQLRKKLAKQNNEIYASLSSSITSAYPNKRKIDKVLTSLDKETLNDAAVSKKSKMYENHINSSEEKSKEKYSNAVFNNHKVKPNRKSKLIETNSTSPNKDRLTTIFLDMQNTSPKSQVFQNDLKSKSKNSAGDISLSSDNVSKNTVLRNSASPITTAIASTLNSTSSTSTLTTIVGNFVSSSTSENSVSNKFGLFPQNSKMSFEKKENKSEASNVTYGFTPNKITTNHKLDSGQVSVSCSQSSQFISNLTPNGNEISGTTPQASVTSDNSKLNISSSNDKNSNNKLFTFGNATSNGVQGSGFGGFKFGTEGETNTAQKDSFTNSMFNKPLMAEQPKVVVSEVSSLPATTNEVPQFTFGMKKPETTTTPTSTPSAQLSSTNTQFPASTKPVFTFGQNPVSTTFSNSVKKDEETESINKNSMFSSIVTTAQSSIPSLFAQSPPVLTLEQKALNTEGSKKLESQGEQNNCNQPAAVTTPSTSASPLNTPHSQSFNLQVSSAGQSAETKSLFSFGHKPQSGFTFTFGQKPEDPNLNKTLESSAKEQSAPTISFSFGEKTSEAGQSTSSTTSILSQSTTVQAGSQNSSNPVLQTSLFSQPTSNPSKPAQVTTQANTFGQTQTSSTGTAFKQNESGLEFVEQAPSFGQNNSNLNNKTSLFGSTVPTVVGFGTSSSQGIKSFGTSVTTQSTLGFGNSTNTKTTACGTPSTQSEVTFGVPSSTQNSTGFGTLSSQPNTVFGTPASQPNTVFGTPASQPSTVFGTPGSTSSTAFGTSATSPKSTTLFETPTVTQSITGFSSTATTQASSMFRFGSTPALPSGTGFGSPAVSAQSAGFSLNTQSQTSFGQPFGQGNKPATSMGETSNVFGQTTTNQTPVPSSGFGSNNFQASMTRNVYGSKSDSPNTGIFGQNSKIQSPPFGQTMTSQSFDTQNKFSFGMSTSNATGFTPSAPNTTSSPVFNFGANSANQGTAYSFGGNSSSSSSNTQTPFAFKGATDTFKFGTTTKENPVFGGTNTPSFSFGAQVNNNPNVEPKPSGTFNFGSGPAPSSTPAFSFGTTPSPSVFNFGSGGSGSSVSSGGSFNFGSPQRPALFGQSSTPSPAPFPVPGTFSIGSGSSQSRPRASSRLRRRP